MATRRIRRLRRALMAVLVLSLAGLGALFWFGRSGLPQDDEPAETLAERAPGDESRRLIAENFEHIYQEGGKTRLEIRGDTFKQDRDDQIFIEGMDLEMFTDAGERYRVASDQALFDPESRDSELEGSVRLAGPDDLELETEGLRMRGKGQVLEGDQPLEFRYGEAAVGGANQLRASLEAGYYLLLGDVWMHNGPAPQQPFALTAQRLLLQRERNMARGDGEVKLSYGPHRLQSKRVTLRLDPETQKPEFIRGMWDVRGRVLSPGEDGAEDQTLRFRSRKYAAVVDPATGEITTFELEGAVFHPVRVDTLSADGRPQELNANYLTGRFSDGALTSGEAYGNVSMIERAPDDPETVLQRISADRAVAQFDGNATITAVTLHKWVVFESPELQVRGQKADLDLVSGDSEFFGEPVQLQSPDGELEAPTVRHARSSGILRATGGAKTQLRRLQEGSVLGGSPLGGGDGPIYVESQAAELGEESQTFLFTGGVRAWRGQDLILAERLSGDEARQTLVASGSVRTLTFPRQTGEEEAGALEVTGEEMVYDRSTGELIYSGGVRAVQLDRTLDCQELRIELDEESEPRLLDCQGEARLVEKGTGKVIQGDRARYRPAEKTVQVTGESVTMRDGLGGVIRGQGLVYDLVSGKARMTVGESAGAASASPESPPTESTP